MESMPISDEIQNAERLEALALSGLMDTSPEETFDRFTRLASQIIGVPVALISLVDDKRQFFKSQTGLPEPWATTRETPLSHSFCKYVASSGEPLIVCDAREDEVLKTNLAVTEIGVLAYAGIPLQTSNQQVIGSFCAIDVQPHQWTDHEVGILKELAAMVMREIELRFVANELKSAYANLKKAEQQRDDLVHMLVHDLRTPLTSLLGGLQGLDMMIDGDIGQRQMLDIALRGGRSLSRMINTVLDVSRGEAGLLKVNSQPVLPHSIIKTALEQVEQLAQQKGLQVSVDIDSKLPTVVADEEKLARVLINLVGNAIQHTPRGGQIKVRVCNYDSASEEAEQALHWSVEDTGRGIPQENFESIFEKFGQVPDGAKTKASTGLGLTFCKMVIEAHGGRIWVESVEGQGSTFSFTLPTPN